ncbi:calcium/sodium antiporter [Psychrobium sp. 1_MG-2023]|uniref:calcium/sodium antiporter n=1 Tax=Psychrobium sp. 1_MG-2023 TaxID=3062624 RepID=UPI000C3299BF|nr:calcium/sodium antiporter [Psychrobium sp. 1_MG-2023]MDP2560699.1 calcium/sodium antiporter [Psychrobium sp. 1_MG-2023]PKF56594.1 calcium/sodium antiporter [Alteromonadales bacterium alter-6D02]
MILSIATLIAGLVGLIWSADKFVFGSAAIARNFGLPPLIIGLTIVAMGSSAPEIMVAITASLDGTGNTAIGNALGSNITNIALVLGVTVLLKPLLVHSQLLNRELPILLLVSGIAGYILYDQVLTFTEGLVLISLFFITIGGLCWLTLRDKKSDDPLIEEAQDEVPEGVPSKLAVFWIVFGMVLLPISSHFVVDGASDIARYFGLSDLVIGLTIIAIGTSLPELAACIASIKNNEHDLALGNIVGSNIFNILAVLAVPALIAPGTFDADAAGRDMYIMLGLTVLLFAMCWQILGKRNITRIEGALLCAIFVGYQFLLFS